MSPYFAAYVSIFFVPDGLPQPDSILSQSSQTTLLDLRQRAAAAQECDDTHETSGGQRLEEVPAGVVQEEHALHGDYGSKEQSVRKRSGAESLAQMADIGTQCRPETQQDGESGSDRGGKDNGDDLRGRLGVFAEDVVDLGVGSVAKWCLGDGEGHIDVAGHGQVEDLLLVRCRRAECANDDGCRNRLRGSEELVGEVLVCLQAVSYGGCDWLLLAPKRLCPCHCP